jgi:hypothetical protein
MVQCGRFSLGSLSKAFRMPDLHTIVSFWADLSIIYHIFLGAILCDLVQTVLVDVGLPRKDCGFPTCRSVHSSWATIRAYRMRERMMEAGVFCAWRYRISTTI